MKRRLIFVLILCMVIVLLCAGCAQERGFIMRDDITFRDLDFLYDGTVANLDVTIEDMYYVMGVPNRAVTPEDLNTSGMSRYFYYFDDEIFKLGVITFIFDEHGQIVGAPVSSYPDVYDIEPFDSGFASINKRKYTMILRDDIREDELDVIDIESTSVDVQRLLGAPHDRIYSAKAGLKTDAYTYPLTNGNTFCISYERNGVIVKAWVIDKDGITQKVLVDRTDEFGVYGD